MSLYVNWAPVVARVLLAVQFGVAAWFKFFNFAGEVAQTAATGFPMPTIAVAAALVLEVVAVISFVLGWHMRLIAGLCAAYVALLAVLFYHDWSTPMGFGLFISHLGLIAALLLLSVSASRFFALRA